jgi:hypothetical protein
MDEGLGAGFWLKVMAGSVAVVLAAALFVVIFGHIWVALGFFGALLVLGAALLAFGWLFDRRERKRRERLAA